MLCRMAIAFGLLCNLGVAVGSGGIGRAGGHCQLIWVSPSAERLAAKEVRRYLYLRTGKLLPISGPFMRRHEIPDQIPGGPIIVVAVKHGPVLRAFLSDAKLKAAVEGLAAEQYMLKTVQHNGRPVLLVVGGDPMGTLYGAYRLAEHLGVRFYLHGDVVPDKQCRSKCRTWTKSRKPLFALRGIQPFHDFPEGPDWWNRDGYKAVLGQLPKMGMNFFGLHCYPPGRRRAGAAGVDRPAERNRRPTER